MNAGKALLAILLLGLSACGPGDQQNAAAPREPGADEVGYYCRMTLSEHSGPKGQILPRGWKDPLWFSSVRDALTYVEQDIVSDREMAGFWVNDMAQGTWEKPAIGSWIEAKAAWYVVGSARKSGMGGSEAVPFKDVAAAEAFARDSGGRVTDYMTARHAVAGASDAAPAPGGGT